MSEYKYIDPDGDTLKVRPSYSIKGALITARGIAGPSVAVPTEDAPAVALAILEAAGYDNANHGPGYVARILRVEVEAIERKAEREAEDAKVREFRESSLSAIASVFNESNVDAKEWVALSGTGRESWYARYRAAREFFEES